MQNRHNKTRGGGRGETALRHALGERVKELACLYGIVRAVEASGGDWDALMTRVVRLLPAAWQYPAIAAARVRWRSRRWESPGFKETRWSQRAAIFAGDGGSGSPAGDVCVVYRAARPSAGEGPFLPEERALIDAVAGYLGMVARRFEDQQALREAHRLLETERQSLQDTTIALRTVLDRIEADKREAARDVRANLERVLAPILRGLEESAPPAQRRYVPLLRRALADVTAPVIGRLVRERPDLTPAEVAICGMIRAGMRSKDIAVLRGIAPATVARHREHIRRKLGLTGRSANLASRLQSDSES